MECKNFSTLRRLLRITAHVFKVIEVLKAKIGKEARDVEINPSPALINIHLRHVMRKDFHLKFVISSV